MLRRVLPFAFVVVATFVVHAQEPTRVTVATTKGDVISGPMVAASTREVVVQVAGQPLTLPIADLRYISFVGDLERPNRATDAPASGLTAALDALRKLRAVTEVGMLRDQYSAKLVELLPNVTAFLAEDSGQWLDVRFALSQAVDAYRRPMSSLSAWAVVPAAMTDGSLWGSRAEELAKRPGEVAHKESPQVRTIRIGETATGRLGVGDIAMPESLDAGIADGLSDRFEIDLPEGASVRMVMTSANCYPHLLLADSSGKRVGHEDGPKHTAVLARRNLKAGRYTVWASAGSRQIGDYELVVTDGAGEQK